MDKSTYEHRPKQEDRILDFIQKNGSINRLQAMYRIGVFELSARINGLEKKGFKFKKERGKIINKYGEVVKFVTYSL